MKDAVFLDIDLFTRVNDDFEKRQYLIQAGLQVVGAAFKANKVYPYLSQLVELRGILSDVLVRITELRSIFPKRISKIDLANQSIEHDVVLVDGTDLSAVEDLIRWALPFIDAKIRDGVGIHDFVESELHVEHVGILPGYKDSGYFFVPDLSTRNLNIFRYDISIFKSSTDRYRGLKTRLLESLELGLIDKSPVAIKMELIKKERELPNPATYVFDTRLEFPFQETILPIAKRKLMFQFAV